MKVKKFISTSLLAVMLLGALASCQSGAGTPADTSGNDGTNDGTVTDQVTEESFDISAELDYNGYEFMVLVTGNYANNDFKVVENNADIVNEAKYKKNKFTEDYLGITINNIDKVSFGSTGGNGPGFTMFNESYSSSSYDYDMGVIGAYDCATLAYSNLVYDLNTMPNLDLDHSWWDQNARKDLTIKDRLFFTAGDISLTYKQVTHCILFNKEILRQNDDLSNPYDLVRNDNWTFDTFGQEIKKISGDENGNDVNDKSDKYGLLSWNDPHLAIITAAGEKILSLDDEGTLSLTLYTERTDEALRKYCEILFDSEHAFNYQYNAPSTEWNTTRDAMFNENRALYYMTTFVTIGRHRNMETDFGVLPYPKLDDSQDRYYHTDTPFSTAFVCTPLLHEDDERTGAVMETLAYYSKEYMTPAYYQKTLVGTYFRDDESADMLDLIFATRCYDLGTYYNIQTIGQRLTAMLNQREYTFASICASIDKGAKEQIRDINQKYAELN